MLLCVCISIILIFDYIIIDLHALCILESLLIYECLCYGSHTTICSSQGWSMPSWIVLGFVGSLSWLWNYYYIF